MGLTKAKILIEHTGEQFEVMFNPEEYTLNKDNNFASHSVPGLSSPLLQFVNGNLRTLEMELFFDTDRRAHATCASETGRVVGSAGHRLRAARAAGAARELGAACSSAACWRGRARSSLGSSRTAGRRGRACRCRFSEFIDAGREAKEVNRQTADFTQGPRRAARRDDLSASPSRIYEDPQLWRPIAVANALDDPRLLVAGESLRIPSLPFTDPPRAEALMAQYPDLRARVSQCGSTASRSRRRCARRSAASPTRTASRAPTASS